LPDPVTAAELLFARAGHANARNRRRVAGLLLGLDGDLDPFVTQGEIATVLEVTRARIAQVNSALQDAWAADDDARALLDALAGLARDSVTRLGGVATVDELADGVLAHLPPCDDEQRGERLAAGLARVALDRVDALARAEGLDVTTPPLAQRRRGGRVALIATDPLLLDAAEAVAKRADTLVAEADAAGEVLVPRQRAGAALADAAATVAPDATGLTGERLARLAGRLPTRAAVSGHGELHDRDISAAAAVGRTLTGLGARQQVIPQEVRDRVRARFPALPPLPERPRLDEVIAEAGLPLVYDEQERVYRSREVRSDTTGLATFPPSQVAVAAEETVATGAAGQRLRESARARSFLALGVEAVRLDRALELLVRRHGVAVVDVTRVLIETLRRQAEQAGVPWHVVRAADAAAPGTRDAMGLAALVEQSLPAVRDAVSEAEQPASEG
jgi:hypothetical protein